MSSVEVFSIETIQLALTIVTGVVAGGWAILRMTANALEKQQETSRKLIVEKFQWAERLRAESSARWENHFRRLEERQDRVFSMVDSLDRRVTTIEICLRRAPCGQLLEADVGDRECREIVLTAPPRRTRLDKDPPPEPVPSP